MVAAYRCCEHSVVVDHLVHVTDYRESLISPCLSSVKHLYTFMTTCDPSYGGRIVQVRGELKDAIVKLSQRIASMADQLARGVLPYTATWIGLTPL